MPGIVALAAVHVQRLPALEASLRVDTRAQVATAVATGELDAGVVDGVAAPSDPLRLPETGLPVAAFAEEELALALLPARVVATGVPLASPRLVHRTELLRGGGAAALVGITPP
jgi:hypothetical protein